MSTRSMTVATILLGVHLVALLVLLVLLLLLLELLLLLDVLLSLSVGLLLDVHVILRGGTFLFGLSKDERGVH